MGEIKKEVWFVSAVLIVISVVITFSTPKSPIERSSKNENGEEWLKIIEDQLKANIDDGWKKIENGSLLTVLEKTSKSGKVIFGI